jgi:hypothetical protein
MAYTDIDKSDNYFNTVLYTGTGTSGGDTLGVTGVGFQPDWVWVKNRTVAVNHYLYDVVRGTGSAKALGSNRLDSESSFSTYSVNGGVASLDSDGFTAYRGTDNTYQGTNKSGNNYASWNWLAGGTASSNTDGSITSTVSANTTSGFSIVSYTGNGTTVATVGHGLGTTPAMIIVKNRDDNDNWRVWHQGLSGSTYYLGLNQTNGESTSSTVFNGQASTNFTIGNDPSVNQNTEDIIAYCFADKKGFSKFGGYTGNGSTDGTFVYTGFKPAFLIVKRKNGTGNWHMLDNKRDIYNVVGETLYPNLTNTELTDNTCDFLSNGFKMRVTSNSRNGSGDSYIYMAFAENPFVTSTGIPGTAR